MSTIFNQLVKHRIEEFNKCNPKGSGKHDVKPGQIVIAELHPKRVGITGETMFCDAHWRPHAYAPFFDGIYFKMNIDVLYNAVSLSNHKGKSIQSLIGEMIHIEAPRISHYTDRAGRTISKYTVTWGVIAKDPTKDIITSKDAGLYVLTNTKVKAKTLGEASENFYSLDMENLRYAAYEEGYAALDDWELHQPYDDYELNTDYISDTTL